MIIKRQGIFGNLKNKIKNYIPLVFKWNNRMFLIKILFLFRVIIYFGCRDIKILYNITVNVKMIYKKICILMIQ